MSNDRICLACSKCGERMMLAKYWGDRFSSGAWYQVGPIAKWVTEMDEWLTEHAMHCGWDHGDGSLKYGVQCVVVQTERDLSEDA